MIRRAGILILLLVSLLGATAGAFACALAAGNADCCAPDGSCGTDTSQTAISSGSGADCCAVGSGAQAAVIGSITKVEIRSSHGFSPDTPAALLAMPQFFSAYDSHSTGTPTEPSLPRQDERQIYLLTGRLRL